MSMIIVPRRSIVELRRSAQRWRPHIRFACIADWPRIEEYIRRMDPKTILDRYGNRMTTECVIQNREGQFEKDPPGEKHLEVVFDHEGRINGVCHANLEVDEIDGRIGWGQIGISVDEKYRRRYVGYAMLEQIIDTARNNEMFSGLYISTHHYNTSMQKLASSIRFRPDSIRSFKTGCSEWLFDL